VRTLSDSRQIEEWLAQQPISTHLLTA
jgi:hypothetical protein